MQISILANSPDFVERSGKLITQHAVESDLFVSIKFKFVEPFISLPLKRHDIHFRSDPNNFVFGLNDYRHLIDIIGERSNIYLINDSDRADYDTSNDTEGIRFQLFDKKPIVEHLLSFRNNPKFKTVERYAFVGEKLDTRRLSTGLIVILHYALTYPNSKILLLGFYESDNRKVLKEGKTIRDTSFHDFDAEREILEAVTQNTHLIH